MLSHWQSRTSLEFHGFANTQQGSYSKTDLNLSWGDAKGRYSVTAFVRNVENKAVLTGTYLLPLDPKGGKVSVSASGSYTSSQVVQPVIPGSDFSNPYGTLPSVALVSMSLNWSSILGSRCDAAAFVTNLANKQYYNYISGGYAAFGFESAQVAEPPRAIARGNHDEAAIVGPGGAVRAVAGRGEQADATGQRVGQRIAAGLAEQQFGRPPGGVQIVRPIERKGQIGKTLLPQPATETGPETLMIVQQLRQVIHR